MTRLRRSRPFHPPGIMRVRRGSRLALVPLGGGAPTAEERAWIGSLAIPPAWSDVWISRAVNGHILAVGLDDADRRQYIYHPQWRLQQDAVKFERALRLAAALPAARARVTRDLRGTELDRERVLAAAFRILDTVAVRVGNEQYATAHGSRGLVTLQRRHVRVEGHHVALSFPAKSGVRASVAVRDHDLATALDLLSVGAPAARLLSWGASRAPLTTAEVNAYVRERTGDDFTAKDFRTLKGCVIAAQALARCERPTNKRELTSCVRQAAEAAAAALGNTPTVALSSYIDPEIVSRFEAGEVMRSGVSPERALVELLGSRSS